MAEGNDALINLSVNVDDVLAQFSKIEKSLKSLGVNNISGLTTSFEKISKASKTSAESIEANALKTQAALIKQVNAVVSNLQRSVDAEVNAATKTEQAELKKQQALLKSTAVWQTEVNKQTALGARQAEQDSINAYVSIRAYQALAAAKVQAAEAGRVANLAAMNASHNEAQLSKLIPNYQGQAGLSARSAQTGMYGGMFNQASSNEEAAMRKSLADRESYARQLKSQVEQQGGLSGFGMTNNMEKSELKEINALLESQGIMLRARPSALEKELGYMGRMMVSWIALGAVFEVASVAAQTFEKSLKAASEFQVQGVLFGAYQQSRTNAGQTVDNTTQNDILTKSIALASQYGDNVNDTAQDLALWYKRTGDIGTASYMTAQALEFQNATGTQLEDTYRTLTALGSQLTGEKLGLGDEKTVFNLSHTHELLEMITAAAVSAGAGLHNIAKNGEAMGSSANSADILVKSLEKDSAALKSLGFNTLQTVALNQSLIRSFGNTGPAAEEAAEKIGRLAGGLAGLSDPSKNKSLALQGIDVSKLTTAQGPGQEKTVLDQLAATYEKLTTAQRNDLAVHLTGARQYQALIAILENLSDAKKMQTEITKNMGLEDQLALDMQGTYQVELAKTEAAWEGLEIAVGQGMLPMLQSFVQYTASSVIPMLAGMGEAASNAAKLMSFSFAQDKLLAERANLKAQQPGAWDIRSPDKQAQAVKDYNQELASLDARQAILDSTSEDLGKVVAAQNSGPVWATRKYQDQKGKTQTETREFVNKAAFLTSKQTQFGAPADVPGYLQGQEATLAVQNIGNTYDPKLKDRLTSAQARILSLMNKNNPQNGGNLVDNKGGAGQLKDYALAGEALSDLKNKYQDYNEQISENKNLIEESVASDKKKIQTFGLTSETLKPLLKDLQEKGRLDTAEIRSLSGQEGQFKALADSYKSKASAAGLGTTEGKGFLNEYYQAESEARRIRLEISNLKKDMSGISDDALQFKETLASTNLDGLLKSQSVAFSQLDKQFGDSKSSGGKSALSGKMENRAESDRKAAMASLSQWPVALIGSVKYEQELQRINDTYVSTKEKADAAENSSTKFAKSLGESMTKGTYEAQQKGLDTLLSFGKGAGSSKSTQALTDQIKLIRELKDEQLRYKDQLIETAGNTALTQQANQLHGLNDEVISVGYSVDQFKEKLDALQSSDWYKAVSAGFDFIGKSLEKSINNSMFGENKRNTNIDVINQTISALDQQKTIQEEMYSLSNTHSAMQSANEKLALIQIQQKITAEQKLAQIQKDKLANPGFLAGTMQAISQDYVKNYIKQLQGSLLGSIGGQDTAQKETNKALQDYVDSNKVDLTNNVNNFVQAVADFGGSTSSLTGGGSFPGGPINGSIAYSASISNSALTGQNLGGGSGVENAVKALGGVAGIGTALGLGMSKTPLGNALSIAGGSLKGGAGTTGSYIGTAGNIINAFGTSADSGIGSLIGGGAGMAFGGPVGASIGSALGGMLGGLFGPKKNATLTPDQIAGSGYAQGAANVAGKSYTQANGNVLEDATLKQGLGGSELQYIDKFVKAHPGGSGLSGASLDLWNTANAQTAGGSATGLSKLHNGQQGLTDASGKVIAGSTQNWKDLLTSVDNTTQSLVAFNGGLNAGAASLVVFNQYGTGMASMPGSYNTPGSAANPANYANSGTVTPTATVNTAARSTQPILLNTTTQLDGKTIAKSTQAYNIRANNSGYQYVS